MAAEFPYRLVLPTGVVSEGEAERITTVGPRGEFGVLADHINFITALAPGVLTIVHAGGEREHFVVSGGLAEVNEGIMTVLADSAEAPAAIDRTRAEADEQAMMTKVAGLSQYDPEYEDAERALWLARARRRAADLASDQDRA